MGWLVRGLRRRRLRLIASGQRLVERLSSMEPMIHLGTMSTGVLLVSIAFKGQKDLMGARDGVIQEVWRREIGIAGKLHFGCTYFIHRLLSIDIEY